MLHQRFRNLHFQRSEMRHPEKHFKGYKACFRPYLRWHNSNSMPIVFGVIGIILIVAGVRDTLTGSNPNLVDLVKADLTGQPNYTEWMVAIFILGAIGYIQELRTLSRLFMAIVVIGLVFSNKGFFAQFAAQTTNSNTTNPSVNVETPGENSSQGLTNSDIGSAIMSGLSGVL